MTSAYDAHGNRTRLTHPDGAFFEYAYDNADRLLHLSENGPSTTLASLFYDAQSRRDELDRDVTGAITRYGYDPISRFELLTQVRTRVGCSLSPDSSMKTMIRPCLAAFLKPLTQLIAQLASPLFDA